MARNDFRSEEQPTMRPEQLRSRPASLIRKIERSLTRRRAAPGGTARRPQKI